MDENELEAFLRSRIPLSAAMAVEVRTASPSAVVIFAPLEPNLNHRDTAFGGSVSAVAILAAWSVLYARMQAEGLAGRIVIRRNSMSYDRPIAADFTATAAAPDAADWANERRRRADGQPDLKPAFLWLPSQNGLFAEAPQRQR